MGSFPLLFSSSDDSARTSIGSRFQNTWFNHLDFMNVVKSSWEQPHVGNGLYVLAAKLNISNWF